VSHRTVFLIMISRKLNAIENMFLSMTCKKDTNTSNNNVIDAKYAVIFSSIFLVLLRMFIAEFV